jgi:hypothetical protein
MVSRDGQLSIIRQVFELTPTSKILWSSTIQYFLEHTTVLSRYLKRMAIGGLKRIIWLSCKSEMHSMK